MMLEIPETNPGKEHIYSFQSKRSEVIAIWVILFIGFTWGCIPLSYLVNVLAPYVPAMDQRWWYIIAAVIAAIIGLIISLLVAQKRAYIRIGGKSMTVIQKNGSETDYYLPDFKEFDPKGHGLSRYFLIFEQEDQKRARVEIGSLGERNRTFLLNDIQTILKKGELPFVPGGEETAEELRQMEQKERKAQRARAEQAQRERTGQAQRNVSESRTTVSSEGSALDGINTVPVAERREREEERIGEVIASLNMTEGMLVAKMLRRGEKVQAIRLIREKSGAGLADCKIASERFFEFYAPEEM